MQQTTTAGRQHRIASGSTASALRDALVELRIGSGDEVIVPSFGPSAPADAVRLAGAVPVFADIDPRTFCLDPDAVAASVTSRTAAILPVSVFGHPAPLARLGELAGRRALAIVQEGDAGEDIGTVARRRAHARFLDSALTGVIVPYTEPGARHLYHQYTVRVPGNGRPDRDAFLRALAVRGVKATASVPVPVHRMPAHRSGTFLPQTELVAADALSLPVHSGLTQRELTHVANACNALGGLI
ncbi:DegT/DnrJ/EryC1/StrS aminotransferase family protein [Streptomyces sp. DvalAA-14]|uniref:DegT/DnrJ/EryC1/StrS family aminotransferase n=1 Tax=unclassified Streptomyces TaxID=2593676 RepID=UPI00081B95AE|nr:DegT/DnrJ/EryC1/StrS family aminotransferase [Streptomyces sp. DvalAA-14]MYS25327.1 DegT/DnrJ/EryC1/StrS aminotransferase [Streptomyces sp. SID4948]SCE53737.1 DegT/DnrJ/EryC1/StrS aminotransferase family protein [Streptomyces sp. DvalAA-14]